jgi:histidinol-phosphate/aromatic aminotransferase/cobyric acid decarboxylase-like protein/choline kinase
MKAIILAAGYGNRMRPLTDSQHKTLLNIGNRTIIERIIDGLVENGIRSIIVGLGYRAEQLTAFLNERYGKVCEFTFVINERYRETNNIYSLSLIFEKSVIDDDVILIESDLVYEPAVIEKVIRSEYSNVALVDRYRSGMDGTVVSLDGDVVTSVIPPHLQGQNFDFSDKYKTLNIYKFSREFCCHDFKNILTYYSRTIDDNCYYELMLGFLIYMQREKIYAEKVEGLKWAEVDDPNDMRLAEFQFVDEKKIDILDKSWGGFWSYPIQDFAFIRNMYFPPSSVVSEIRNNLFNLLANYGSSQAILNEKLAYLTLRPAESMILLNGASQVFPLLGMYFKGSKALLPVPSFGEYPRIFPRAKFYSDNGSDYQSNLESAVADSNIEVVVIVNPNNPTGSIISSQRILEIIRENPEKFFFVDESFIDFSAEKSLEEISDSSVENFIIAKSLSKVLGVPGVRLGYVFTHNKKLRDFINGALPIWNTNSIAEFLLEILLKHRNGFSLSIKKTIEDREAFIAGLRTSSAVEKVFGSSGNFLLVKLVCSADQGKQISANLLAHHSIYVKNISEKFLDGSGYFRIAVRLPSENINFISLLDNVTEKLLDGESDSLKTRKVIPLGLN